MIVVRPVQIDDDFEIISELIYLTDPYIYPTWFNDLKLAKIVLPMMMKKKCIFSYKNMIVAEKDKKIIGLVVFLETFPINNYKEMKQAYSDLNLPVSPQFEHVYKFYIETLKKDIFGKNLVCVAVLKNYRRQHVATELLSYLKDGKQSLAVVKDNVIAQKLYFKMGFKIQYEYAGYLNVPCYEMRKGDKSDE